MLENKPGNFNPEEFITEFAKSRDLTQTQALAMLRKLIPKESYYQTKIKQEIRKKYPTAFVRKITQGNYSEGGIPDILAIVDGHYFGFEVKRPIVGVPSKLQERSVRMIQMAGGTAAFVIWPEEAIAIIERWRYGQ